MKRQPNLSLAVVGKTYGNPTSGWMDEQLAAPGQTDFVVTEVSHAVRAMPPNKDKTVQIRSAVSMITTTRSQFSTGNRLSMNKADLLSKKRWRTASAVDLFVANGIS